MLPGNIFALPLAIMLTFSNESQPSAGSGEASPRPPSPLPVPGRWSTTPWGLCSNPCGAGEERRQVSCVLEDVTATLIVATDGFCAPPKPSSSRQCYQHRDECANEWVSGDWGQCSARCGGGQRSRLVECHRAAPQQGAVPAVPAVPAVSEPKKALAEARCVPQLRPDERRACNLQPCPDGRRAWLRTSDGRRPRRIRLFAKFTLRCPFPVYWTPADDRTKRKYAWFKDGQRLPLHEDKYTQTDSRAELRVKGADEADSGTYTCASLTANPQGRVHNITVTLQRIPGEPTPPPLDEDGDGEESPEREDADAGATEQDGGPSSSSVLPEDADDATTVRPASSSTERGQPASAEDADDATTVRPASSSTERGQPASAEDATTGLVPPTTTLTARQPVARSKREIIASVEAEEEDADASAASSPSGAIAVVAARYEASPFSDCSASCGADGLRQRSVRCVDNETGAKLAMAACEDLGPPPPPQDPCNRIDCPPSWQWPSWTGIKCSRPCGGGAKWRQARCSQTLADGSEASLAAESCAHLGAGEERRDCHRAPCRLRVREGELVRLDCRAANSTWRHGAEGDTTVNLGETDKYVTDNDTGTLFVFGAEAVDAGQYLCEEHEPDGRTTTHRFEVTVLPTRVPATRPPGSGDELFERICKTGTPSSEDEGPPKSVQGGQTVDMEAPEATTEMSGPTVPWHLLLTSAAPAKGRILGVFT